VIIGYPNKYLYKNKNQGASMNEVFKIIGDLGMPVAAALAGGYFVNLTIKL
jgi:hypothetical protein